MEDKDQKVIFEISKDICDKPMPEFVCGDKKEILNNETEKSTALNEILQLVIESFSGFSLENGFLNGKGKLFLHDGNIYEGEVVSGIFHGKGKFTWTSGIVYEGDFEDGEIKGQGKFSWPDGSWYSGDVIKGMPNGTGKYYQLHPFLMYVGDWLNGERHGIGSEDHNVEGTCFYEGEWKNDLPHGQGKLRFESGNIYEGSWKNGKPHDYGRMEWRNKKQMYEGQWVAGIMEGHGEYYWYVELDSAVHFIQPNLYKGRFVNGSRHGFGILQFGDGSKYEGEWKDNSKEGYGIYFFKNGSFYEANFVHDVVETQVVEEGTSSPIRLQEIPQAMVDQKLHTVQENFCPDLKDILQWIPWRKWTEQQEKVGNVILRHLSFLKNIYKKYGALGVDEKNRTNRIMDGLQFLQLLRDLQLYDHGISLAKIHRILKKTSAGRIFWDEKHIYPWKFVKHLSTLAYIVYRDKYIYDIGESLNELIVSKMKKMKKEFHGVFYAVPERTKFIYHYVSKLRNIFRQICAAYSKDSDTNFIYVRDFLTFWKVIKLYQDPLNTERMVAILAILIPVIYEVDTYKIDVELCLLDFIDVVLAAGEIFPIKKPSKGKLPINSTLAVGAFLRRKRQMKVKSEGFALTSKTYVPPIEEANLQKAFLSEETKKLMHDLNEPKSTSVSSVPIKKIPPVGKERHSVIPLITDPGEGDTKDDEESMKFPSGISKVRKIYFPQGAYKDFSGNLEIDSWLYRVDLFLQRIFFPALDHWSRVEMEAMIVAEERMGLASTAPLYVVKLPTDLPDARLSSTWIDEN